jgi:hypothetical protein
VLIGTVEAFVRTSPRSWERDDIGRLAAISVIRNFLNDFIERDLAEVERREEELHQ